MRIEQAHKDITFAYLPDDELGTIQVVRYSRGLTPKPNTRFSFDIHWDRRKKLWQIGLRLHEGNSHSHLHLGEMPYPYQLVPRHSEVRCDLRLLTSMANDYDVLRENLGLHFSHHAASLASISCRLEPETPLVYFRVTVHNKEERKRFTWQRSIGWALVKWYVDAPKKYRLLERFVDPLKKNQ